MAFLHIQKLPLTLIAKSTHHQLFIFILSALVSLEGAISVVYEAHLKCARGGGSSEMDIKLITKPHLKTLFVPLAVVKGIPIAR